MTPLERYKLLVDRHDWTYGFSDDGRVFRRGELERAEMKALYNSLPTADMKEAKDYYTAKYRRAYGLGEADEG